MLGRPAPRLRGASRRAVTASSKWAFSSLLSHVIPRSRQRSRPRLYLRPFGMGALDPEASTAPERAAARGGAPPLPADCAALNSTYQDQNPTNKVSGFEGLPPITSGKDITLVLFAEP
jgi:hypothetical protein